MLKKIFTLLFLLTLSSCGYEAIDSKKNLINFDFSIGKLTFVGNRNINLKIKQKLNRYTLSKKDKDFNLTISSKAQKETIAKDTSGDPIRFKNTIKINIEVSMKDDFKNNLQIIEDFSYNNIINKFDLKKYEREIENNLAETATDKLIFKLSNIQ